MTVDQPMPIVVENNVYLIMIDNEKVDESQNQVINEKVSKLTPAIIEKAV